MRLAIHLTSASRAATPHFHSLPFSSRQIWLGLSSGASMPCSRNLVPSHVSVSPSVTTITMQSAAQTGLVKIKTKPTIHPRMRPANITSQSAFGVSIPQHSLRGKFQRISHILLAVFEHFASSRFDQPLEGALRFSAES